MTRHPVRTRINKTSRSMHRWAAILAALPVVVIIASGIVLQLKKEIAWIQPPTASGSGGELVLTMAEILDASRAIPEMAVETWDDIDRLDVRPGKGVVKVRATNRWEAQLDLSTGDVVHLAYRRSDLIEAIHTGNLFSESVAYYVFLPAGVFLFVMWVTGMYLWALPVVMRRRAHIKSAKRRIDAAARRLRPGDPSES